MTKLTKDQQHDFIADVTHHLLTEIEAGVEVFAVLSFKRVHGMAHCTHSTIKAGLTETDKRLSDLVSKIVTDFMNASNNS